MFLNFVFHGGTYFRRDGLPTRIRFQWVKPCLRERFEIHLGGRSWSRVMDFPFSQPLFKPLHKVGCE